MCFNWTAGRLMLNPVVSSLIIKIVMKLPCSGDQWKVLTPRDVLTPLLGHLRHVLAHRSSGAPIKPVFYTWCFSAQIKKLISFFSFCSLRQVSLLFWKLMFLIIWDCSILVCYLLFKKYIYIKKWTAKIVPVMSWSH